MESILKLLGGALGLLVPALFIYVLNTGISNAQFDQNKTRNYKTITALLICGWTILVWVLSINGFFSYHEGDSVPSFLIPLFVPVVVCILLLLNGSFRTIVNSIPVPALVGVQTFRLAGFTFLIVANIGILPAAFASGGYGDIITGSLAIIASLMLAGKSKQQSLFFWLFNAAGLIDLLNVAFLLLYYYPAWNHSAITSAAAFTFSLVMVPAIAAPVALILHFYSIRNYIFLKTKNHEN